MNLEISPISLNKIKLQKINEVEANWSWESSKTKIIDRQTDRRRSYSLYAKRQNKEVSEKGCHGYQSS